MDRSTVSFDNVLDNAKAQPGSSASSTPGLVYSIESFEQAGKVLFGDSDTGIGHVEPNVFALVL